jgi:hypothetical protein
VGIILHCGVVPVSVVGSEIVFARHGSTSTGDAIQKDAP